MSLSVAIIARDEAASLPDILLDVEDIADEVVVLDTGSVDNTIDIAEKYGARVGTFEWCDDFSAARNAAFSLCLSDWVLWLDADDRVPTESAQMLAEAVEAAPAGTAAIYAEYRLYEGPEDDRLLLSYPRERLIRLDAGLLWKGRVHEVIAVPSDSPTCDGWVEHRPTGKRESHSERNLRILQGMYADGDDSDRTVFYLANEYRDHGMYAQALAFYSRRVASGGWAEERAVAAYELGKMLMGKDNERAHRNLSFAWSLAPWRAEPLRQLEHLARCSGETKTADQFRTIADTLRLPKSSLFVEPWAYREDNL